MWPLVAKITVSVVPLPVPVVVEFFPRAFWVGQRCRTAPKVKVHIRRDGVIAFWSDALAAFVAQAAGKIDFTNSAFPNEGKCINNCLAGAALRPNLTHASVLARGCNESRPFMYVVTNGFFDVGILAGLHGPDARECVPVIGCGGADEVDGFVVECLTHINDGLRAGSLFLLDFITPSIGDCFVRIDDDSNLRAFIPEVFIDM